MSRTGARRGSRGHRDRKPITFDSIRRPIVVADRRALRDAGAAGQREHRAGLDAFARRVLGLPKRDGDPEVPAETRSDRNTVVERTEGAA